MAHADDEQQKTWREKYLDHLRDSENKEKFLQQNVDSLRRGLLRVSLAGQGLTDDLDTNLEALRKALRKEASAAEIDRLVEKASQSVLRLEDERRGRGDGPDRKAAARLADVLDQPGLPAAQRKRVRALCNGNASSAAELLLELADILESAPATDGSPSNGSWLTRWFSGRHGAGAEARPPTATSPQDDGENISEQVRETLLHLLDQLIVTPGFVVRLDGLKGRLRRSLALPQLPQTLEEIAALMIEASREENEEFEAFLKQLTTRLDDIHGFLREAGAGECDHRVESERLDHAIRGDVRDLQDTIRDAADLNTLKTAVTGRLETIVQRIGEYQALQEKRGESAEQRLQDLAARLESTEEETDRLRQNLMRQRQQAQTDPLTRLANRDAYQQRLDFEYARWKRYGHSLTLLIGDIDHFKDVNDKFGHAAGDKVLKVVAKTLQANVREIDFLGRFGGEEFVILMPETDLTDATHAGEKLRQAIAGRPFHSGEERVPVTMSFGVARFGEGDTPDTVFQRADTALYRAKDAGRNCVRAEQDR